MNKVSVQNFRLGKAKVSLEQIYCEYTEKVTNGGIDTVLEHTIKAKQQPHPDMLEEFAKLKDCILDVYHLDAGYNLGLKYLKKGDQKLKAETGLAELKEKLTITGISLSGSDDDASVIITAKMESKTGKVIALNSPLINLSNDQLGYELALEEIIDDIKREIHAYLFGNKRAQLNMFQDGDDEEKSEGIVNQAKDIIKQPEEPNLQ